MDPVETVESFLNAIIEGNEVAILGNYVCRSDTYVFLEGPRSSTMGFDNIAKGWKAFCQAPMRLRQWSWQEGPFLSGSDTLSCVYGILRLEVEKGASKPVQNLDLRATYLLRRQGDDWKLFHEHCSIPAQNPYGSGDWLPSMANRGESPTVGECHE